MSDVDANRTLQAELYGEPLREVLGHCAAALGVNQSGLAEVLGISAPMLSQLINGHRVKIANPAAAERLRQVVEVVGRVDAGSLTAAAALEVLATQLPAGPLTTVTTLRERATYDVLAVFRSVASAGEYLEAAEILRGTHPEIADLLRVCGTERADRAEQWLQGVLR